jgi:hypothetical protein
MATQTQVKTGSKQSSEMEEKVTEAAGALRRRDRHSKIRAGERDPRSRVGRAGKGTGSTD